MNNLSRTFLAIAVAGTFSISSLAAATDVRVISLDNQIQIDSSGLAEQTIATQIKLETTRAIQQYGQFPLSYLKDMNSLSITDAATIKADGRRIPVDLDKAVFDQPLPMTTQAPMYSQIYLKSILFPALEPGDSIALRYTAREKESFFPGHTSFSIVFSEDVQYSDAHIQVRFPKNRELYFDQADIVAPSIQDKDGWKVYDWHYTSQKKEPSDETQKIAAIDTNPRLIGSTFTGWADLAFQYNAKASEKVVVTPAIGKLADDITQGVTDRREQARALYNWVNQNIRYVAVYFGAGPVVPHDTSSILENRYGDCKDHVVLLEALLKAKGIDSTPALINSGTSYRLPGVALGVGLFNHVITYLPEFNLFVDATEKYTAFGELAFVLGDKPVLLTKSGEIKRTPVHNNVNTREQYNAQLIFDKDGNATISADKKMTGYETSKYRFLAATQTPEKRAKSRLEDMKLTGHIVFDDDDPKTLAPTYTTRWKGALNQLADFDTKYLTVPHLALASDMAAYAGYVQAQQTRSQNTICPGKTVELHYQLTLPSHIDIASLPQNVDITRGVVRYTASYSTKGQTVDIRRVLDISLASNVCTPEQLREWLPVAQAIQKDHKSAILFK